MLGSRLIRYRAIIPKPILLVISFFLTDFDTKHHHYLLYLYHLLLSNLQIVHPLKNKDISKNPLIPDQINDAHNYLLSQVFKLHYLLPYVVLFVIPDSLPLSMALSITHSLVTSQRHLQGLQDNLSVFDQLED